MVVIGLDEDQFGNELAVGGIGDLSYFLDIQVSKIDGFTFESEMIFGELCQGS